MAAGSSSRFTDDDVAGPRGARFGELLQSGSVSAGASGRLSVSNLPDLPERPSPDTTYVAATRDRVTVPGQLYALVSFVGPTRCTQKADMFAMKLSGVFATRDEAAAHARVLRQSDATFDIFTMEMYGWAPIPPDALAVRDHVFPDEQPELNELIKGQFDTNEKARTAFVARVKDVQRDGLDAHLLPHERLPKPTADTLEKQRDMFETTPAAPSAADQVAALHDPKGKRPFVQST